MSTSTSETNATGLTLITEREEGLRAHEAFVKAFAAGAERFPDHLVGWQGGSVRADVWWRRNESIWGVFLPQPPGGKKAVDRFWTCFGIVDPRSDSILDITVEMNPPHHGENRRTAGVFLRDNAGQFYVGHSGKIGGGRPGVGQAKFRQFSRDLGWQEIRTPEGRREMLVFGPMRSDQLPDLLASFVHSVADFKNATVRSSQV